MDQDQIHQFLMESHQICIEAQFIIDSLPNAEQAAVERVSHQLDAIRNIILVMNDQHTSPEEQEDLIAYVDSLLLPLDDFLENPPPAANANVPRTSTKARGRPSYILDVHRACLLHDLGNTWKDIALAMGVSRSTLYLHLGKAGLSSARKEWTVIDDEHLDEIVSEISMAHPFVGSTIILGHLEARGVHLPRLRVQESLRRVDKIGVLVRWAGIIKRRIYKVRGSNALWHNDGNEKLRPWGFWVHGCVDGHSRLIIYLSCHSNKQGSTILALFLRGVGEFGWPSRARGDFGTENNEMERELVRHWGIAHRAYLRGRSCHNVRIERLWRDIRKDSLEAFRQIFCYLENNQLLDMANPVHRTCLFLVFHQRIQDSLDRTREAWNHHKIRTAHNKTPVAIFELSREAAINRGYWTGDPGDDLDEVNGAQYGFDGEAPLPPATTDHEDPEAPRNEPEGIEAQRAAGILLNDDDELADARNILGDFDYTRDDGNWGIDIYCEAVIVMIAAIEAQDSESD